MYYVCNRSNYNYVDWLNNYLRSDQRVFEYGSGYSTLMFSDRCKEVFSVETNKKWIREIKIKLIRKNVTFLIPEDKVPFNYLKQIENKGKFDIVLIDDQYRWNCVPFAVKNLSDNGIIVIDDVVNGHTGYFAAQKMNEYSDFYKKVFRGIKKNGGLSIWQTNVYFRKKR